MATFIWHLNSFSKGFRGRRLFRLSSIAGQKRYKSVNWSYVHGPGLIPLTSQNIGHFVNNSKDNYGDLEAVVNGFQGIRKNYTQFADDINGFAAGLLALDLNLGDRLGIWSPNCYEWMVAQHAASKAGLIVVPINPAFQLSELEYCMRKVNLRAMVTYDKFKTQDYHSMMTKLVPEIADTKTGHKIVTKTGTFKFNDIMKSASNSEHITKLEDLQQHITMSTPAYIMFTSGTTGKPKGAVLSHHNVVNSGTTSRDRFGFAVKKYRRCTVVPLFHGLGCLILSLTSLIHGNTVVLAGPSYDPARILKTIQDEKCDDMSATTTVFVDLINHPDVAKTDFSSLKRIRMGGTYCPPTLLQQLVDTWKCEEILTGYGSTELSGGVTTTSVEHSVSDKLNTAGIPYEFTELKIVDQKGDVVPRGEPGEIWVKGYKVMLGYWEDDQKTKETITPDGWYRSGDVGILLENDCLQVVDRIRDLIIRGGSNIYPKEIEDFLMNHPKIQEVHVIGVPDERMGEEICAWVQCKNGESLTEDDLRGFCKGQITHYKIPRYFRFVGKFPKTPTGKVQKNLMRDEEKKRER